MILHSCFDGTIEERKRKKAYFFVGLFVATASVFVNFWQQCFTLWLCVLDFKLCVRLCEFLFATTNNNNTTKIIIIIITVSSLQRSTRERRMFALCTVNKVNIERTNEWMERVKLMDGWIDDALVCVCVMNEQQKSKKKSISVVGQKRNSQK